VQLFLIAVASFALTMALIPPLLRLAPRVGLVDRPGGRKMHAQPIPRIGGVALGVGSLLPIALLIEPMAGNLQLLLAAASILLLAGLWDDRAGLHWSVKLAAQFMAATLIVTAGGISLESITLVDKFELPEFVAIPISIFFLVGVTNAINLSDGLDGLAAGTTLLCVLGLSVLGLSAGDQEVAAIGAALGGALLGFLRFNTHPARVFMGDTGSQYLGFMVGVLALKSTQGVDTAVSAGVPLLLLAWPILDTFAVMGGRLASGQSPFLADRRHLHHRLLALGFGHHEAVLIIYGAQALLFIAAYLLRYESDLWIAVGFVLFAAVVLLSVTGAERRGWRRAATHPSRSLISGPLWWLAQSQRLPRWTLALIGILLASYVVLISASTAAIAPDIAILATLLLIATLVVMLRPTKWPVDMLPRALAYVTVAMLVYLDQMGMGLLSPQSLPVIVLFGAMTLAVLLRFRLQGERRALLTPLDALVAFVVLVVPWISRILGLPFDFGAGLAKVVVLCYAIELLPVQSLQSRGWAAGAGLCLMALAIRGLAV
jgi:UDP-GlcNAc:undecaprenyl-phosphate GlcNAc-1-phosphate transferase